MYANFHLKREKSNKLVYGKLGTSNVAIHFHSQIEIYVVRSGRVEVVVNGSRKTLVSGEISVALSYDSHGFKANEGDVLYVIIPTDRCGDFFQLVSGRRLDSPFISDEAAYSTIRAAIESLLICENELSKQGYVFVILGAILGLMREIDASDVVERGFSAEMLIYISNHFKEELTLSELARKFGYNPSYLSRSFRSTFGISFVKYLTMLRLREAILLLKSEGKSVTECAMESGFGSMRSFYRAFKDEFGVTPKTLSSELANISY